MPRRGNDGKPHDPDEPPLPPGRQKSSDSSDWLGLNTYPALVFAAPSAPMQWRYGSLPCRSHKCCCPTATLLSIKKLVRVWECVSLCVVDLRQYLFYLHIVRASENNAASKKRTTMTAFFMYRHHAPVLVASSANVQNLRLEPTTLIPA